MLVSALRALVRRREFIKAVAGPLAAPRNSWRRLQFCVQYSYPNKQNSDENWHPILERHPKYGVLVRQKLQIFIHYGVLYRAASR
jgi:hypothetical protein